MEHGSLPLLKNKEGKTPLMLAAPHYQYLTVFKQHSLEWFDALHEALVDGKKHPAWCQALGAEGAEFNHPELYDSPTDSLLVFAYVGMDMNMPFEGPLSDDQLRIMYTHGKMASNFDRVLAIFQDDTWVRLLHNAVHACDNIKDKEYIEKISTRRAVTNSTYRLQLAIRRQSKK